MITCKHVYLHVCESLDQDLESPRCRAIKRHLETCPDCRAYVASLKKTITLYRAQPTGRTPRKVHARLITAIEAEMKRRPGRAPDSRRRSP
jgi:anti-sigma factor RsiW